jgi:peptidoglycan/LPS O-acetylase OafA/YrhL
MPSPSSESRLDFLDVLRGIAVLLVFMTHALNRISPSFDAFRTRIFDIGICGVFVFFLCSGFIIPASLERHGTLRFWVGRIFRLYPLYWVCIAATLLAGAAEVTAPDAVLANLTMFQTFLGYGHVQAIFWSLTIEMVFYGAATIMFVLGVSRHTMLITSALLLTAALVEGGLLLTDRYLPLELLSNLAGIFLGTVFYRLYRRELAPRRAYPVIALALVVLIGTVAWHRPSYILARGGAILIFGAVFVLRARALPRWLAYLGEISYSVYLSHIIVMHLIGDPGPPALNLALWAAGALLISSLTYRWIEQPMIRAGRHVASILHSKANRRRSPDPLTQDST